MTLNILDSFNKTGAEAEFWTGEIAAASNERYRFIPFNHAPYLPPKSYVISMSRLVRVAVPSE